MIGAVVLPAIVPIGCVLLGLAFADFRWRANKGQVITRRLVILALVSVAIDLIVSIVIALVPALQQLTATNLLVAGIATALAVIQEIASIVWLPLIAGYFGMALWMRWRYGPDGEPKDD